MTSGQRRTVARGAVGFGVGLLLASVLWAVATIGQVRSTQVERLPNAEQNDETLAIIKDCTQVGGRCYVESQRRTSQAVMAITDNGLRVTAAIAVCQAEGIREYAPLVRCAARLVAPAGG